MELENIYWIIIHQDIQQLQKSVPRIFTTVRIRAGLRINNAKNHRINNAKNRLFNNTPSMLQRS